MLKKGIWLLMLLGMGILAGNLASVQGALAEEGIILEASYGLKGHVKPGSYFPVQVTLGEKTPEEGWLIVRSASAQLENIQVEMELTGAGTYTALLCANTGMENIEIYVEDEQGEEVDCEILSPFFSLAETAIFTGLLMEQEEITQWESISLTDGSGRQVEPIVLNTSDIPTFYQALDGLDVLFADAGMLERLDEEQQDAISLWTENGGYLLCFGSLEEALPLYMPLESKERYVTEAVWKGVNLYSYGQGQIGEIRCDEDTLLMGETSLREVFRDILFYCLDEDFLAGLETKVSSQSPDNQALAELVTRPDVMDRESPNPWIFAAVLAVYILVALPVTYIFLKKIDRRHYLRGSIITNSCLFALLLFLLGTRTQFTEPFVQYLSIWEYGNGKASHYIYASLQSPDTDAVDIHIAEAYQLLQIPEVNTLMPKNGGNREVHITRSEAGQVYTVSGGTAFSTHYFQLFCQEEKEGISASLTAENGSLEGKLENTIGQDISFAAIIWQGRIYGLEQLPAGEEIFLTLESQEGEALQNAAALGEWMEQNVSDQVLSAYIQDVLLAVSQGTLQEGSEPLFIGAVKNAEESWMNAFSYKTYGCSMILDHLSFEEEGTYAGS